MPADCEVDPAQSGDRRDLAPRHWFEPPADALADPVRFMADAMSHVEHDDVQMI